jgi:hypothetical protein
MKICNKCKQEKLISLFPKHRTSKDGYENTCKDCKNILAKKHYKDNINRKKQYYLDNKIEYSKRDKKYSETKKKWREDNKDQLKEYYNNWRKQNIEILSQKQKEYNKKRQPIRNIQDINKRNNDSHFRILCSIRGRIGTLLKKNKTSRTTELLGCSIEDFKQHLEKHFKPEMNWDNYGKIWEIDHIKPCSSFDLSDIEQQKQCFHYSNTQPLFKTTNIAESFGYNEIGNRNKSNYE